MISYRSTDGRWINYLQQFLETNNIMCWRDRRMEVGSNWSEDITNAVRTSGSLIVCISDNYISSSLCTKEVRLAHEMGKVIKPLVLPETEHKENVWDKIVQKHYDASTPPHTIASEISGSSWIDFRGCKGKDPTDQASYEAKYKDPLERVRLQITNLRKTGFLWDLSGSWQLTFYQDPEDNEQKVASFQVKLSLKQVHSEIVGGGQVISPKETIKAHVEGGTLEASRLTFTVQCDEEDEDEEGEEEGDEEDEEGDDDEGDEEEDNTNNFTVSSLVSSDGKSIEGTWLSYGRVWCSGTGVFIGKRG